MMVLDDELYDDLYLHYYYYYCCCCYYLHVISCVEAVVENYLHLLDPKNSVVIVVGYEPFVHYLAFRVVVVGA